MAWRHDGPFSGRRSPGGYPDTKDGYDGVPASQAESASLPASQFLPHARLQPIDFLLLGSGLIKGKK